MAKAFLDPKTSARLVRGELRTVIATVDESVKKCGTTFDRGYSKLGRAQAAIENGIRTMFGDCVLDLFWEGRTIYCVGLDPVEPSDESNRPFHGMLLLLTRNIRSNNSSETSVTRITTHAMQRMLERRHRADLMPVLREELKWAFLENLTAVIQDLKAAGVFYERHEVRIPTTNGHAVVVFEPRCTPVMVTWYPV